MIYSSKREQNAPALVVQAEASLIAGDPDGDYQTLTSWSPPFAMRLRLAYDGLPPALHLEPLLLCQLEWPITQEMLALGRPIWIVARQTDTTDPLLTIGPYLNGPGLTDLRPGVALRLDAPAAV